MATAIITITDCEDGSAAQVSVKFEPLGADENSTAHALAAMAINAMTTEEEREDATYSEGMCGHG
jgi:hypothetical protein